jgi:kojibiose phosphorylase
VVRILSGEQEHHISADIAYAVWRYWRATADDEFLRVAGAEILLETARFWSSRSRLGADGQYHIDRVVGPDEYHEGVDDNAYTNVMAQWNLERAAEVAALMEERWPARWHELHERLDLAPAEVDQWLATARKMYTGFDARTGLFEQFRGYFDLEFIDVAAHQPRSAPMDVLLGRERVQRSQVIKQADVVMLLALFWERFTPEVRAANFRYYEPRTGHGSSLSPPVHALVAARLGDVRLAQHYLREATAVDLADNMGNAAGGVHMATLGGIWQAMMFGFAGLAEQADGLMFAPRLAENWRSVRFSVCWRRRRLAVKLDTRTRSLELHMTGAEPMTAAVADGPTVNLLPRQSYSLPLGV